MILACAQFNIFTIHNFLREPTNGGLKPTLVALKSALREANIQGHADIASEIKIAINKLYNLPILELCSKNEERAAFIDQVKQLISLSPNMNGSNIAKIIHALYKVPAHERIPFVTQVLSKAPVQNITEFMEQVRRILTPNSIPEEISNILHQLVQQL